MVSCVSRALKWSVPFNPIISVSEIVLKIDKDLYTLDYSSGELFRVKTWRQNKMVCVREVGVSGDLKFHAFLFLATRGRTGQ